VFRSGGIPEAELARWSGTIIVLDIGPDSGILALMKTDTSRLRQRLAQARDEQHRQLDLLLGEHGPLFRGTLGTRSRVCGKPSCRCAKGERHESKYLSASDGGSVRQVHVPARDEVSVALGVERYRRFREGRTRLRELAVRQLELVDALGQALLAPYPTDNPLPPPKRGGRRKQGKEA